MTCHTSTLLRKLKSADSILFCEDLHFKAVSVCVCVCVFVCVSRYSQYIFAIYVFVHDHRIFPHIWLYLIFTWRCTLFFVTHNDYPTELKLPSFYNFAIYNSLDSDIFPLESHQFSDFLIKIYFNFIWYILQHK